MKKTMLCALVLSAVSLAGAPSGYRVLQPIVYGTVSLFPVVGAGSTEADGLMTLDEGVSSGEVRFAEHDPNSIDLAVGGTPPFLPGQIRHRITVSVRGERPLLLIAGEVIHSGGHKYGVAEDCIVPAGGTFTELGVRDAAGDPWSRDIMAIPHSEISPAGARLRQLNALGVVVAVNGQLLWAETFASAALFQRYMAKLLASLENGAMPVKVRPAHLRIASVAEAVRFLDDLAALSESTNAEPRVYRLTRLMGRNFDATILTSLLPGSMQHEVHVLKRTGGTACPTC